MFLLYKKFKYVFTLSVLFGVLAMPANNAHALGPSCVVPPSGSIPESNPSFIGFTTSILHGNCDSYAAVTEDNKNPNCDDPGDRHHTCSCEGDNNLTGGRVDVNNFELYIAYRDDISLLGDDLSCYDDDGDLDTSNGNCITLNLGSPTRSGIGAAANPMTFTLEQDGDLFCVTGTATWARWTVEDCGVAVNGTYHDEGNKGENITADVTNPDGTVTPAQSNPPGLATGMVNPLGKGVPYNCVPAPIPEQPAIDISWANIISPVCTNYDSSSSLFKYSATHPNPAWRDRNRAFTGVVMECIEDTMNNLFEEPIFAGRTLYEKFVEEFSNVIRVLLILYVILFGYPFIYGKRGLETAEWHWFALKFGLVVYFAMFDGIANWLPSLQVTSKSMSLLVLEASSGDFATAEAAREDLNPANAGSAARRLLDANNDLIQARISNTNSNGGNQGAVDAAEADRDIALQDYNEAKSQAASYGYRYCDFRDLEANTGDTYPAGKEYMRLWDMIDCKISKVLGVGENLNAPRSPHLIVLTMASILTNIGIGFVNFILAIIITVFIVLITIRVVHIYMIAAIGLILLCFIAPLIIPFVLFKFTKNIFDQWLSQVIAYVLQPVILFAFLGFLFAAVDMAVYEGNHQFVPMEGGQYDNRVCMKYKGAEVISICTNNDFRSAYNQGADMSDFECEDQFAMGCIMQKVLIRKERRDHTGLGTNFYYSTISYKDAGHLFVGLIQVILVLYMAYAVLGLVEELSVTLTNAAGGGAVGMSRSPKLTPHAIGQAAVSPFNAAIGRPIGRKMANALERRAQRRMIQKDANKKAKKAEGSSNAKAEVKDLKDSKE